MKKPTTVILDIVNTQNCAHWFQVYKILQFWEKENALMIVWIEIHLQLTLIPRIRRHTSLLQFRNNVELLGQDLWQTLGVFLLKKILSNITNIDKELFLKSVLLLFLYKRFLPKTTKQYILTYSKKNIEVKKTYWKSFIGPKKT